MFCSCFRVSLVSYNSPRIFFIIAIKIYTYTHYIYIMHIYIYTTYIYISTHPHSQSRMACTSSSRTAEQHTQSCGVLAAPSPRLKLVWCCVGFAWYTPALLLCYAILFLIYIYIARLSAAAAGINSSLPLLCSGLPARARVVLKEEELEEVYVDTTYYYYYATTMLLRDHR